MIRFDTSGLGDDPVPYAVALERQKSLHSAVLEGREPDTVLLLEHPAVYTAGRRTSDDERPTNGAPVVDVDRGGKITWHGPGQLVGYPIVRLPEPVDVVAYVRFLEAVLIDVLARSGVTGERVEGRSGVWSLTPGAPDRKIAAVGIHVASGVTTHGFALNCDNATDAYDSIVACGIRDAGVTTASELAGRRITPVETAPLVEERFRARWDEFTNGATAVRRDVEEDR